MQKKKSMGGAPPNAKRITSAVSKSINIPEIKDSSISDFQPNRMGGGMGSGFGGFGTGAGGPGGGMGTGGGGGRIKFFGFDADASSVILAIDVSGSMERNVGGPAGIAILREEISKTINSLSPGAIFNIICFSGQADACFQKSVRATEENKKAALRFMGGYYDGGAFGRTRTENLINMKQPTDVDTAIVEEVKFAPLTVNKVKGLEGTAGSSRMDLALVAAMERNAVHHLPPLRRPAHPIRDGKAPRPKRNHRSRRRTLQTNLRQPPARHQYHLHQQGPERRGLHEEESPTAFNGKHKSRESWGELSPQLGASRRAHRIVARTAYRD